MPDRADSAKADVPAILEVLERLYPDARPELNFTNPYETLVATMLSAQCTDVQVNKVTPEVFRAFPDVGAMAETTPETLYPMVQSCGFKSKATNIVMAARDIVERHGGRIPDTLEALTSLRGVGRKTANVVLANAFGIPAMAVDTHVFRVSNRLGIASASSPEQAEIQLMEAIPREKWHLAHLQLILHGRRICKARNPLCPSCALLPLCAHPVNPPAGF
ncbi:MAG TPA: endonuclease III [Candidatus Limnocylindria bacterium]|nr:endonuclease III [Candidatus Limnocylindria bacterium]